MPVPTAAGESALHANLTVLSPSERATAQLLVSSSQAHLFAHWTPPRGGEEGEEDVKKKKRFLAQCALIESAYLGGIATYVTRARDLLRAAQHGENPYKGYKVLEPTDSARLESTADYTHFESIGVEAARGCAFVIVAGGLGERLGFQGIKLALPSEIVTNTSFIQLYCQFILELQHEARLTSGDQHLVLPLAIMTSDDTHALTEEFLKKHDNFGMESTQLTLFKQGKVPSMIDNEAHFTVEEKDAYALDTKPHGHGDVHMLLYQNRIIHDWVQQKQRKHVIFFQDTNVLVFRALIAGLGVSVEKKLQVNSMTVPRVQGDAVGAICKLVRDPTVERQQGAEQLADVLTISVEYNQLEGLMGKGAKEPLVPGTQFSVFPGNMNVLIFDAVAYLQVLEDKKGVISEFVNPKYNPDKQSFKKPTRLECMMQDYAKLLDKDAIVSFTQLERWTSFSAVKNALADAAAKQKDGNAPECGASGEADLYHWSHRVLKEAGVHLDEPKTHNYKGVSVSTGAKIVLKPNVGVTQQQVRSKFPGGSSIQLHDDATLVVDGRDVVFKSLQLHGALLIHAVDGAKVTVEDLHVKNSGYYFAELSDEQSKSVDQVYQIRGYQLEKRGAETYVFDQPGEYVLSDESKSKYAQQQQQQ